MSGQYCKCPNHNRGGLGEHKLGGHHGQCEGCCYALDSKSRFELENERLTKAQASPDPVDSPSDPDLDNILKTLIFGDYVLELSEESQKMVFRNYDFTKAKSQLTQWKDQAVREARHEQRHQALGVSRWIAVGEEHGYWAHPMTIKKARQLNKPESKETK